MIEKIRKWVKDKTGVSPIIAIILMVAITVVLAATIYVWVSGMGKTGGTAPTLSCNVDNIHDKITITDVEAGTKWNDMKVIIDGDINTTSLTSGEYIYVNLTRPGDRTYTVLEINSTNVNTILPASKDINTLDNMASDTVINSGDFFKIETVGSVDWDWISITIIYKPTNTNLGTWTIYS